MNTYFFCTFSDTALVASASSFPLKQLSLSNINLSWLQVSKPKVVAAHGQLGRPPVAAADGQEDPRRGRRRLALRLARCLPRPPLLLWSAMTTTQPVQNGLVELSVTLLNANVLK